MGCAGGLRDPGKVFSAATGHATLTYKPVFVFDAKHSISGRITRHFPLARPGGVTLRVFKFVVDRFVAVQVLPLKTQVLRHMPLRHAGLASGFAPGAELPVPDGLPLRIRHPLRQAVQLRVVPVQLPVVACAVNPRQRLVTTFGNEFLN